MIEKVLRIAIKISIFIYLKNAGRNKKWLSYSNNNNFIINGFLYHMKLNEAVIIINID